jgi:hypothetical protein
MRQNGGKGKPQLRHGLRGGHRSWGIDPWSRWGKGKGAAQRVGWLAGRGRRHGGAAVGGGAILGVASEGR